MLDATFFDNTELPGRNIAEISHPFVRQTCQRLEPLAAQITDWFRLVHFEIGRNDEESPV